MTQAMSKSDSSIFSLLAAAKKGPPVEPDPVEASDYDWDVPCRFTPPQLENLGKFSEGVATAVAEKLSVQFHEETQLFGGGPTQHYAGRLSLLDAATGRFYFPITREDGEQCGLVVIPAELARQWVGKALGAPAATGDGEHEFSTLESALMRDVIVAVVEALSNEYRPLSGVTLQCGMQVPVDNALPEARSEDEYCVMAFRLGQAKDQAGVSFILSSDLLGAVATSGITVQAENPGETRANMQACIALAPVTATVSLMTLDLSLREVLNLEVGDVIISDKIVGETLEVLVGGAVVLSGLPVNCDGHYSLQITA
jgi:flagellar motor switch protein FliM